MKDFLARHDARTRAVALGLLVILSCSHDAEAQPSHGLWVFGVVPHPTGMCSSPTTGLLDEDPEAVQLLGFCATNQITELYLSLGSRAVALSDSRFPYFMRRLKSAGKRVEAIISCSGVSECRGGTWQTRIDQVKAYNDGADPLERFDGLHLDLEPWVDTGSDFTWVDDLIDYYQYASSALEGSNLTLAADISGVKVISDAIDPQKRQALLDLATHLVLLEYEELAIDRIHQRVDLFRDAVDLSAASFAIATRVKDFGAANACQNGTVLNGFDDSYTRAPGYAGWATFKYSDSNDCNHYNDPAVCPGDCCLIPSESTAASGRERW